MPELPVSPVTPSAPTPSPAPNKSFSLTTILKLVLVILLVGGLLVGLLKCQGCHSPIPVVKIGPTVERPDTTKPITETPHSVTFTPPGTKDNPNPAPVTVFKPIEGKVTLKDGKLTIQNSGLTLEPKAGLCLTNGDGLRPYASARVLFVDDFGLEVGLNDRRAMLGVDYRLPILDLLTISAGESLSFTGSLDPYIGLSAQLKL